MANEALEKLAKLGTIDELAAATSAKIAEVEAEIPTKTSQLNNDSDYQTGEEVSAAIKAQVASVYKPGGTILFAELPELSAEVLGIVYDIKEKFTTTDDFREGAGKKHPAGTNVVVVQDGEAYKFDVLSGEIDLSGYVEKETGKGLSTNDFDDEEKEKLDGIAAGATKVTASETAGHIEINGEDTAVIDVATGKEAAAVIEKYFPKTNT